MEGLGACIATTLVPLEFEPLPALAPRMHEAKKKTSDQSDDEARNEDKEAYPVVPDQPEGVMRI